MLGDVHSRPIRSLFINACVNVSSYVFPLKRTNHHHSSNWCNNVLTHASNWCNNVLTHASNWCKNVLTLKEPFRISLNETRSKISSKVILAVSSRLEECLNSRTLRERIIITAQGDVSRCENEHEE